MRCTMILAAAAAALMMITSATGAQAQQWCGYAAHANSIIECGYSSDTECENAIGKGGMCFVDPDYALNLKHVLPVTATPAIASKPNTGRG